MGGQLDTGKGEEQRGVAGSLVEGGVALAALADEDQTGQDDGDADGQQAQLGNHCGSATTRSTVAKVRLLSPQKSQELHGSGSLIHSSQSLRSSRCLRASW